MSGWRSWLASLREVPVAQYVRPWSFLLVFLLSAAAWNGGFAEGSDKAKPVALVAEITGVIGPATAHYVEKAIAKARTRHAEVLILRLDTPGGLVTSMRDIIESILASPVPVVGYVAPPGAHAASAGTYILYATSVAAMAPGTNIGAATPVHIGGIPGLPTPNEPKPARQAPSGKNDKPGDASPKRKAEEPQMPADPMVAKSMNDAIALILGLAELRGRNADWAEKAVREAATLHARQALEEHVIDIIAGDIDDLLRALNGRKVMAGNKQEHTLSTFGIEVERFEPDFMTRALGSLANPNIALILMLIGIYGLIFEFMNPGMVLPGVAGAISLLLGLYALQELPLDYAGLALLLLGIAFMIAEAFAPTFGVLGFGGIIAFVIGAAMLIDTDIPEYRLSWTVIGSAAAVSASFLILFVGYMWRTQARKVQSGPEQLIGSKAFVLDWSGDEGHVWVEGERWNARGDRAFAKGDPVRVQMRHGLTLIVVPY
jgi:membrane-bound serine protease (ClpP class)